MNFWKFIRSAWLALSLSLVSVFAHAETQWYAVVYGENHELLTGASEVRTVKNGKYLDPSFVGKTIYIRVAPDYSLTQYQPRNRDARAAYGSSTSSAVAQEATASASGDSTPQASSWRLTDSGVTAFTNGDFKGWYCSSLKVTKLEDKVFRLDCDNTMRRQ